MTVTSLLSVFVVVLCCSSIGVAQEMQTPFDDIGDASARAAPAGGTNRQEFVSPILLNEVAHEGMSGAEMAFVFSWYGDSRRLAALWEFLKPSGKKLDSLRFGPSSSAFTSDESATSWTLLHVAVLRNAPDLVQMLMANGHAVDIRDDKGVCPSPLEILLSRGAKRFETKWPSQKAFVDMALLLLRNGAKVPNPDTLAAGIASGDTALVEALLDACDDVNRPCSSGNYPLHEAVLENNAAVVSMLLKRGANPSSTNFMGRTAIDLAGNDPDIRRVLLKAPGLCIRGSGQETK